MSVMQIPGHDHQRPREVTLQEVRDLMGDCQRCPLGVTRTNLVFGVGNPRARVMFIGEGPGRNEDLQGEPFVGAAGKKLDALLGCAGLRREEALALIKAGDEVACGVFDRYLDHLAREIHNIQCLLDPDKICLGGGISQDAFFVESVREAVRAFNEDLLPFDFPMPEIVACKFFNDANLVGAYRHFVRMQEKRAND